MTRSVSRSRWGILRDPCAIAICWIAPYWQACNTIKFTYEWSKTSVNFLDVQVGLKNGHFTTDLYVKPTDTHQYLHPASCHPYHCKKAIPFSQALRISRICSDDESFEDRCEELYDWLMERGYKHKVVVKHFEPCREPKLNYICGGILVCLKCTFMCGLTWIWCYILFQVVMLSPTCSSWSYPPHI